MNMEEMKQEVRRYLRQEYDLLKDFKENYPEFTSMHDMVKDKIKGAEGLAKSLELITYEEINELKKDFN